jgi:3-oxoacyl-[acyl-carrier protein] reductase
MPVQLPKAQCSEISLPKESHRMSSYLIVGGSKGIGQGIVERLVARGEEVLVLSRTPGAWAGHDRVKHIPFDVMSSELLPEQIPGSLRGFAYCPGSIQLRSFRALKPEIFREDFELHVIGAIRILQAILPALKAGGPSSVLLFSSVAVQQGMFAHASIAASKGAIEGLIRTLAAELSPEIRVNGLAPALTSTAMTERFFSDPEKAKLLGDKYPLGRTGTVDDLASIAEFLLSEKSHWITGQVFGIDGGMSTVRK